MEGRTLQNITAVDASLEHGFIWICTNKHWQRLDLAFIGPGMGYVCVINGKVAVLHCFYKEGYVKENLH
jgi:hypothetical protein